VAPPMPAVRVMRATTPATPDSDAAQTPHRVRRARATPWCAGIRYPPVSCSRGDPYSMCQFSLKSRRRADRGDAELTSTYEAR
jgi:hypothetical protein